MTDKKKIVYIISNIQKSLAFEWIAAGLKDQYRLSFVLLNPESSSLEGILLQKKIEVTRIRYRGKKDFFIAFLKTVVYLIRKRPSIIHVHLIDAQLIGLTAGWVAGVPRRIYTRHNSNFHHVYHPKGIRLDRWSNRMATQIVSISQATDYTLFNLEQVTPGKVVKIHHGFDLDTFSSVEAIRVKQVRTRWAIPDTHPVVGVIARQIEWKGIQFIIPAFQKFLEEFPDSFLVLANAVGPYEQDIGRLLRAIPENRVVRVPFEEDIAALYFVFDLYVHTPVDSVSEAFGQTYVEALAAGVPSIVTLSGVASEFIVHEDNALVVDYQDATSIYHALIRLWTDAVLRERLRIKGRQDVTLKFGVDQMITSLKRLYDE